MTLRIQPVIQWLLLIGLACLTGCKTADEAHSGHMVSVEISGHTESEIQQAAAAVFQANGYTKAGVLTFEKAGTSWETANYGGWSADKVWIRMRADISPTETGQYILDCDAYVVEGHGEAGMEIERKFWFAKRTECKQILDKIKATLESSSKEDGSSRP